MQKQHIKSKSSAASHSDAKSKAVAKTVNHAAQKQALRPFLEQVKYMQDSKKDAKAPTGWFSVSRDMKLADKDMEAFYQKQLLGVRAMARSAIGSDKIRTKLFYEINTAGTIATAYATSVGLTADSSAEFVALSGLFDEYRVRGGHVRFQILNSQGTPSVVSVWAAVGYDSTYNTTPTSIVEVLESTQSELYGVAPEVVNNFYAPRAMDSKGFYNFRIRIPAQAVAQAASVTGGTGIIANFPGEWIAVGSNSASVGYLRTYVQSPGSGNTITYRAIVELDVEWRERT